jgi:ethanolamine permease
MSQQDTGVKYASKDKGYFEQRQLKRHAGVWSLWALGVGAVISGQFSGWNLGFAVGGWGGLAIASAIIAVMYLGLTFSIAEMSPALPHTGAAYSFARTTMGPWGGFVTGLCENVEYVLTPAVVVFFMGSYLGGIFETSAEFQPVWWVLGYVVFVALNIFGVALSFGVTLIVTLLALAVLVFFYVAAIPHLDFNTWAPPLKAETVRSCPWAGPACWRRCRSRFGCSWRLSNCRWRPRNPPIRRRTCLRASCSGC